MNVGCRRQSWATYLYPYLYNSCHSDTRAQRAKEESAFWLPGFAPAQSKGAPESHP